MKINRFKKKQKSIAERKTEVKRKKDVPYTTMGLGMLLWIIVTWLFFGQGLIRTPELAEGQKIPSTFVASVDFECENLHETSFNRSKAAEMVPPVFMIDPAPAEDAIRMVETIFSHMADYAGATTNQRPLIINSMNGLLLRSKVDPAELLAAFPSNTISKTKITLLQNINEVMGRGILSDEYRETLFNDAPDRMLAISRTPEDALQTISQQKIHSTRKAVWSITESIPKETARRFFDQILLSFVIDNMTYDETATTNQRKLAEEATAPVVQHYSAGTTLARAGEAATPQTLLFLKKHEQQRLANQDVWEQILEIIGNSLFLLVGLAVTTIMLRVGNAQILRQPDKLLLLIILSLLTLGIARLQTHLSTHSTLIPPSSLMYLVPYALAVLLAGILLGGGAAISLGFWCSFATAVLFDKSFNVFALGMLVTITATSTVRNVHRRSSLFKAGIWVCAVKVLYVLVSAILNRPVAPVLIGQIIAAILSGMLAIILTLLLIPVFEKLFKITTDITLLELSDMGHPLLQKMAMQAPGTYHHSLMVATLAQNAAEAIGANPLLIRVCAYYHDIGKMAKPEFFSENIQQKENPHDELSPHMSALVISSHVKEGLSLAKRHKLPKPILDAIEQHHGNGLISYFYRKAKDLQGDGETTMADVINDSDFRYGGAPAISPEMAILSLADASEAAARSIEKPSPTKISNMMDTVFSMKIRDGQMDYANLTMAEINAVKQSFVFSLSNMLHGRIPYPKENENNTPKSTDKPSDSTGKASETN